MRDKFYKSTFIVMVDYVLINLLYWINLLFIMIKFIEINKNYILGFIQRGKRINIIWQH